MSMCLLKIDEYTQKEKPITDKYQPKRLNKTFVLGGKIMGRALAEMQQRIEPMGDLAGVW